MSERLFLRLEEDPVHGPESSAPEGTVQAFAVRPSLRSSVSHILSYRETLPDDVEVCERVLPDGAVRLVFDLGDATRSGAAARAPALAIGASTSAAVVTMRGRSEGLSIGLRPGAAAALLGVPAGELANAVVPLRDLWRGEATDLLDRIAAAPDDAARVSRVQACLERRLGGHEPSRAATHGARLVAASGGRLALRDLAAELGLGERRLQQLFHAHVGLSPRAWSRLARMHDCLRSLRRSAAPAWASVAVDHGFYDQAHLVNEFRALCGITPAELFRRTISGSSKTAP